MKSIYLAGPIQGRTFEEATEWRNEVASQLYNEIDCFSPLRGKNFLRGTGKIKEGSMHVLHTQRGIFHRDINDVRNCDLLFVNIMGAEIQSTGSIMEIAWASILNKPVVLMMEEEGNRNDHPMIREACPFIVQDLDEAIQLVRTILLTSRL